MYVRSLQGELLYICRIRRPVIHDRRWECLLASLNGDFVWNILSVFRRDRQKGPLVTFASTPMYLRNFEPCQQRPEEFTGSVFEVPSINPICWREIDPFFERFPRSILGDRQTFLANSQRLAFLIYPFCGLSPFSSSFSFFFFLLLPFEKDTEG